MSTVIAIDSAFKPELHTMEECLAELEKYGNPRVSKISGHWYSKIEVFVTGEGVKFDVASDFECASPRIAVNQCYIRLVAAFKKIKETT